MRYSPVPLFLFFILNAPGYLWAQSPMHYQQQIEDWHQRRIASLKAADGWINLAGLYWLAEGKNSFGSARDNQIVFPDGSLPDHAGFLERRGNLVILHVDSPGLILVNGSPVREAVVFSSDASVAATMSFRHWKWVIIQREDKIGIRLRNLESPLLQKFQHIDYFPIDSVWKHEARLVKPAYPRTIAITNVLGQTTLQPSPGKLFFDIRGVTYSLDALEEGEELFVIFGDDTNGLSTYPSGRFLYAEKPGPDGKTTLDFNKAFNPPCAFTPYATCPLPPPQNRLPVAVTAGEKNFHLE